MPKPPYATGLDVLLRDCADRMARERIGLVAHPASLTADGEHAARAFRKRLPGRLRALFGPEHGYGGSAGAGEAVRNRRHPAWDLPVISLYGESRKPKPESLKELDRIVFDLQDLGVRCYTYAATLRLVLEAAAEQGIPVTVADRPVPFPNTLNGPRRRLAEPSFVAALDAPLVYGMTPAETARWLAAKEVSGLDLTVVPMEGYARESRRSPAWGPWVPPSPAIRSWESAWCYPATVFTEALPGLDCMRGGLLPFQVLGASWIRAEEFAESLSSIGIEGAAFSPIWYTGRDGAEAGGALEGVRIVVRDPDRFRPVSVAVAMLAALQNLYGKDRIWSGEGVREDFFDILMGDPEVRPALKDDVPPGEIARSWDRDVEGFEATRRAALLYPPEASG